MQGAREMATAGAGSCCSWEGSTDGMWGIRGVRTRRQRVLWGASNTACLLYHTYEVWGMHPHRLPPHLYVSQPSLPCTFPLSPHTPPLEISHTSPTACPLTCTSPSRPSPRRCNPGSTQRRTCASRQPCSGSASEPSLHKQGGGGSMSCMGFVAITKRHQVCG